MKPPIQTEVCVIIGYHSNQEISLEEEKLTGYQTYQLIPRCFFLFWCGW